MVYTICAVILTCCLGGVSFFAFLALVLDVLFAAGFIAIAVLTRDGADSCKGFVRTPIGNGNSNQHNGLNAGDDIVHSVKLHLACRLNTAAFAVAIIGAFLFLCTAVMQVMLVRHHKKEKRLGPSPDNNYTSGYGKKRGGLFGRKNKKNNDAALKQAEAGNAPLDAPAGYHTGPTGTATNY